MSIVGKSQSGRACAEPASRPSAPRSGGGAKRRALTSVSTRARCWLDDAAGDHDILRSTRVQFLSVPRARQQRVSFRACSSTSASCIRSNNGVNGTEMWDGTWNRPRSASGSHGLAESYSRRRRSGDEHTQAHSGVKAEPSPDGGAGWPAAGPNTDSATTHSVR